MDYLESDSDFLKRITVLYVEDDEDGYTKEDLEGYIEEYADAQRRQDEAMKVIRIFFPAHDWWELNTGDY